METISELSVDEGERVPFVLTWFPSHEEVPEAIDPEQALADTESFWREWSEACPLGLPDEWQPLVRRSLIVLKALTYDPTGGIVAAPTTSLPEWIGSVRNWDYRYCWLRDATLTLLALLHCNHADEAGQWRRWLLRAIAGDPADVQIMYGVAAERRLTEFELPWLDGYEGSRPIHRDGGSSSGSSTISRAPGAAPTKGSGRSGASAATSFTRRPWRGSRSIAQCGPSRSRAPRVRSIAGA
jgi:GH15 family glucan-1,4-alpha-glucosidase